MSTHSSILAWRIPWTEEPGGLQSIVSQRAGHNWSDLAEGRWSTNETNHGRVRQASYSQIRLNVGCWPDRNLSWGGWSDGKVRVVMICVINDYMTRGHSDLIKFLSPWEVSKPKWKTLSLFKWQTFLVFGNVLWPSNPTAGHTHRGNQKWKRHMYPSVHHSTVYNSQDMETT